MKNSFIDPFNGLVYTSVVYIYIYIHVPLYSLYSEANTSDFIGDANIYNSETGKSFFFS